MHLVTIAAFVCSLTLVYSDYIITTPRRWPEGGKVLPPQRAPVQVCASLFNSVFDNAADNWHVTVLNAHDKKEILPKTKLSLPQGRNMACRDVETPNMDTNKATVQIQGQFGDNIFDEEVNVTVVNEVFKTFIQPDKALYKPGQKVQFRILTIDSVLATVWKEPYELIYVQTPKGVRIAQWRNVTNNGLVHLSLDLHKEADKGYYSVWVVPGKDKSKFRANFEVNEYVLPRYEVTIKSPHYITGNDTKFTLEMCARYTFGQPVVGKAFLSVHVGNYARTYANLTQRAEIDGCTNFTFPTKELRFDDNNCHIRISSVNAEGKVIEDGTNNELKADNKQFLVHRKAINFADVSHLTGTKEAFLPSVMTIGATYPDGSPADNEKVEACTHYMSDNICRNFTTDTNGQIEFVLPNNHRSSLEVRAVNYPRIERNFNDVMEESKSFLYRRSYNTFTESNNASISIYYSGKLQCEPGKQIIVNLPVIYVAKDQATAQINVQTMSKLYVVNLHNETINLEDTELPFIDANRLLPLEKLPPGFVRGVANLSFALPDRVSPKARIVVWFKTDNNAVVADETSIDVTPCLSHNVKFKWSVPKAEPGTPVTYTIEAGKNSVCSVGAIDKSVELLRSRSRLTIQSILDSFNSMDVKRWDERQLNMDYCLKKYKHLKAAQEISKAQAEKPKLRAELRHSYVREEEYEAINIFMDAGYHVFSNLNLEKKYCDAQFHKALKKITADEVSKDLNDEAPLNGVKSRPKLQSVAFKAPARPEAQISAGFGAFAPAQADLASDVSADSKTGTFAEEPPRERVFFPETWLWDIVTTDETGKFVQNVEVPDTITEWIGNAVCIKDTNEVGISSDSSIITFTPFFTDLTLPPAVKRGEILPVIISTFSYSDSSLPVSLKLVESPDYELVKNNEISKDGVIQDCIPPNKNVVHTIKIIPKVLGMMNITVEAFTNAQDTACSADPPSKSDKLIKPILVKAEGFLRERVWNNYVCAEDVTAGEAIPWNIEVPASIVNGSDRAWVNGIGDLVGPAIQNIESLVRMPYGCGEQNLITFTPNVFILDYLNETNKLTDEIKNKLVSYLNSGYQRQLRFVRRDGSSSTFGNRDESGSTWLTAFVLKSFSHAKKYITIDEKVLKRSVDYLKNNISPENGCFESTGKVVNKMLQGGHSKSGDQNSLLNAYIVAALLESGYKETEKEAISKAIQCFSSDSSTHPYSLALRAYALVLSGSPEAQSIIDQLVAAAVVTDSEMRWSIPGEHKNTAMEVETAAYALMALLSHDRATYTQETRKIVRWLNSKRNNMGGFVSTQDTVVALQALSLFSKLSPNDVVNMDINMKVSDVNQDIKIAEENKFLQQRFDLPSTENPVSFTVNGSGCSLIQGVLRYNVEGESGDTFFAVNVTTQPLQNCNQNISICARYLLNDEASNMAIISVNMVTGYKAVTSDLDNIVSKPPFKRYETDRDDVTFYLDEITSENVCTSFTVEQEIEVGNARPGTVRVYDYYQPEISSEKTYTIEQCAKGEQAQAQ